MKKTEILRTLKVLALAALAFYMFFQKTWLLCLCAYFLAIQLIDNPLAGPTARAWMKLAGILGDINSRILLGLIFYLLLTPLAFFYRLLNRNAAGRFTADTGDTLFEDVPETAFSKESFEKTW